jgi:hypothetical protein
MDERLGVVDQREQLGGVVINHCVHQLAGTAMVSVTIIERRDPDVGVEYAARRARSPLRSRAK